MYLGIWLACHLQEQLLSVAGWDKQLGAESGFCNLLQVHEILADHGFTIRDELALRGATLRIPHVAKGKEKQLYAHELETRRSIRTLEDTLKEYWIAGKLSKF